MLKSRPLFLIVITLCLLMAVIASYWVALMPQRTLRNLQAEMLETSGIALDAKLARLDVSNGFGTILEDVTLSNTGSSPWQLSAKSFSVPGMLGGSMMFDQAVLDIDVASVTAGTFRFPDRITFRDGVLKLRDPARQAVMAVTDINGDISREGTKGLQGQLAMVWGSHVSDLSFDIEDVERFAATGSPMDVTLKSKTRQLGFSGQGRADKGFKLAGQVTTEATDIGGFLRWLGMPVQVLDGVGTVSLQSGLSSSGLAFTFGTVTGDVGGAAVKGNIILEAGADRAKLSGDLNLSTLSLWGPKTNTSILAQSWSEKPLPVSDVAAVDLDLTVTAGQLKLRQRDFGPVNAQLKNAAGQMTLVMPDQKLGGGTGNFNITLTKSGAGLKMETAVDLKSVSAQSVLGGLLGFDALDGAVNVKANLKSEGQSIAGLVSTLAGQLKLSSPNVTVLSVALLPPLIKPQSGWNPEKGLQTGNVNYDFDFAIQEGIATLRSGVMNFDGIALKTKGEIDALRQALTLQLAPKGKNTDPKMSLSGPWAMPEFSASDVLKEKTAVTPPAN
jgi:hypothetical protein